MKDIILNYNFNQSNIDINYGKAIKSNYFINL